jgi:uncharacterized membrane protein YkvA (DUF1232 family)
MVRRIEALRQWARRLKQEIYALYLAYRDPRVPWHARLFAAGVVAYAFSPIDLIPDFIPVLGLLDDLVIVPLGIWLALKMVPAPVMVECRAQAAEAMRQDMPVNRGAAAVIVGIWLVLAALAVAYLFRALQAGN